MVNSNKITSGWRNFARISCGHIDGVSAENGPPGTGRIPSIIVNSSTISPRSMSSSNPTDSSVFCNLVKSIEQGERG